MGLPGGVGAAGLTPLLVCLAAIPGIWGSDLPGDDLAAAADEGGRALVGDGGLVNLDGMTGLALPGT